MGDRLNKGLDSFPHFPPFRGAFQVLFLFPPPPKTDATRHHLRKKKAAFVRGVVPFQSAILFG